MIISNISSTNCFSYCTNYARTQLSAILIIAVIFFTGCQGKKANSTNSGETSNSDSSLLLPITAISQQEKNKLQQAITKWYDSVLKNSRFNGGILVSKGGNIIFEKYKGTVTLPGTDSIDANTPFHIASVSKTFTAMAVVKLAEQGKLNLDDSFSHYFPAFNYPGITVTNLLSHRSGLPNYLYFMEDLGWDETIQITNTDILNYLVTRKAEIKDISAPGTHFTYCNTNYALLALLIEKVSGKSYPAFIQQTFFDPLHMKSSYVSTPANSARKTPNYDGYGRVIKDNYLDKVYGDKNIYSTCRDLLTWHRALSGGVMFNEASLAAAYQPYSNEHPGVKNYGLGWRMNIYPNGKKVIFHNGWWHGNNAVFVRMLDEDATIIVTGSRFSYAIYKAYRMVNIFSKYSQVLELGE